MRRSLKAVAGSKCGRTLCIPSRDREGAVSPQTDRRLKRVDQSTEERLCRPATREFRSAIEPRTRPLFSRLNWPTPLMSSATGFESKCNPWPPGPSRIPSESTERFLSRLRKLGFETRQRNALAAITTGAAARLLRQGQPLVKFIEQVEYNGRRLAKLNLPPSAVLRALKEYDRSWIASLERPASGGGSFRWVREQLHFCVTLTLNNAYYRVREAETQSFYEQFRIELEARNLEELLHRFLKSLIEVSRADAGRLYMLNEEESAWVRKAGLPQVAASEGSGAEFSITALPGIRKKLARPQYLLLGPDNRSRNCASLVLEPAWANDLRSCWSIPLATGGRTAGVMQFGFRKEYEWLPRERELLAASAERCLMAAQK